MTYEIVISFAEEDRPVAEDIAASLKNNEILVYYDKFDAAEKWGANILDYESEIYGKRGKYCLVLLSKSYYKNELANFQRQAAQQKALQQGSEYILPVRLDKYPVQGFLQSISSIDYRDRGVSGITNLVRQKLGMNSVARKISSFFSSLSNKLKIRFELSSSSKFVSAYDQSMHGLHASLLKVVNLQDIKIVGCEANPHRVQVEASPAKYDVIYKMFLTGELNKHTGTIWNKIANSNPSVSFPAPNQTPLTISTIYDDSKSTVERSVVCHLEFITGFEKESKKALAILGSEIVSDISQCKIYLCIRDGHLYAHSNFQKVGCEYSTKIATEQKVSLFTVLINLIFLEYPDNKQMEALQEAHVNNIQYFATNRLVAKLGVDFFCNAMNVQCI